VDSIDAVADGDLLVDIDLLRRRQHRQADSRIRPRGFLGSRFDPLSELAIERVYPPAASTAAPSAIAIHRCLRVPMANSPEWGRPWFLVACQPSAYADDKKRSSAPLQPFSAARFRTTSTHTAATITTPITTVCQ
jgi:hypothetical protein